MGTSGWERFIEGEKRVQVELNPPLPDICPPQAFDPRIAECRAEALKDNPRPLTSGLKRRFDVGMVDIDQDAEHLRQSSVVIGIDKGIVFFANSHDQAFHKMKADAKRQKDFVLGWVTTGENSKLILDRHKFPHKKQTIDELVRAAKTLLESRNDNVQQHGITPKTVVEIINHGPDMAPAYTLVNLANLDTIKPTPSPRWAVRPYEDVGLMWEPVGSAMEAALAPRILQDLPGAKILEREDGGPAIWGCKKQYSNTTPFYIIVELSGRVLHIIAKRYEKESGTASHSTEEFDGIKLLHAIGAPRAQIDRRENMQYMNVLPNMDAGVLLQNIDTLDHLTRKKMQYCVGTAFAQAHALGMIDRVRNGGNTNMVVDLNRLSGASLKDIIECNIRPVVNIDTASSIAAERLTRPPERDVDTIMELIWIYPNAMADKNGMSPWFLTGFVDEYRRIRRYYSANQEHSRRLIESGARDIRTKEPMGHLILPRVNMSDSTLIRLVGNIVQQSKMEYTMVQRMGY